MGWQALLHTPLRADEVIVLAQAWQIPTNRAAPAVINLRLNSLTTNLGAEPLTYALAQGEEAATQAKLWRGVHRDPAADGAATQSARAACAAAG